MNGSGRQCSRLSDFKYEEKKRVYVPSESGKSYPGNFLYSDGIGVENYILRKIKKAVDLSDNSEELMTAVRDWPSYYHLGAGRSNIFKALDLPAESDVLELGSGCGALTRYLGENFKSVDGVEGSHLRAQIASERCRGLKNVKIHCSDIGSIEFTPVYDVVVMAGVLEYAPLYCDGNGYNSCSGLIRDVKSALKPDGVLVIAIENKIGIKYWAGCPEDHTGRIYESIQGYPTKKSPVTFSKKEITEILNVNGLNDICFYYCFPDYKFTSVIFSDIGKGEELYLHNWVKVPFSGYDVPRIYTFHEGLVLRTLSQAGVLRDFANSFLIVAGQDTAAVHKPDWSAKKFTTINRRKEYRCVTTLRGEPHPHIEKAVLEYEEKTDKGNSGIRHIVSDSSWYKGDLLIFDIYKILLMKNFRGKLFDLMKKYYEELLKRYSTGDNDEEGFPLLRSESLDFIFRNIIKRGDEIVPIDMEWAMDRPIPADYVLYRCVLDIIEAQYAGRNKRIKSPDRFAVQMIKKFLPLYGRRRHYENKLVERHFQSLVTTGSSIERIIRLGKTSVLKNRAVLPLTRTIWNRFFRKAGSSEPVKNHQGS